MKTAISACLAKQKVRYNKKACLTNKYNPEDYFLICPEVMAGLGIPRNPIEIKGKVITNSYDDLVSGQIKVVDQQGNDYSQQLLQGVNKTLQQILDNGVSRVILKSKSPTCGSGLIYDGTFTSKLIIGNGILTDLLIKHGIEVVCEEGNDEKTIKRSIK